MNNQWMKRTLLAVSIQFAIGSLYAAETAPADIDVSPEVATDQAEAVATDSAGAVSDGAATEAIKAEELSSIIARFKLSCDSADLHSLKMVDDENQSTHKLKAFQGLKSLVKDKLEDLKVNSYINSDYVYTCIVLQAEKYIKANGLIVYSTLEDWAISNFLDIAKDKSTLKAKCRNCWNWYYNRNWALYHTVRIKKNVEEVMATRVQHAKNMAQKKVDENISKIKNAITGLMADSMFKKKNGTWNGKAIADYLSIDPRTVNKYLKDIHRI